MHRLKALIKKETLQIFRDFSSILIAFFLPLLLLFLYGSGVSLDLKHLKVAVVMEDPEAQSLLQAFQGSRYFDVKLVRDRRELIPDIEKGAIRGFIVIPSYFSEFRKKTDLIAPIQVIADGSEANTANFVQYYAAGALQNWLGGSMIKTDTRFWYNEELQSRFFLLSGSLAIIMTLIGTLLTALVVSREWERGTMEALISTPVKKWEIVAGKTLPYFFLGLISMAICVFVSTVIYGLPLRGSFFALFLLSSSFLICSLAIGLLISLFSKVQIISSQIAIIIGFLPAYILSGFLFEIESMPKWIQYLSHFIPAKYFVQSLQTLFLTGDVWSLFWKNIAILLLISAFLLILIFRKIVKRLD